MITKICIACDYPGCDQTIEINWSQPSEQEQRWRMNGGILVTYPGSLSGYHVCQFHRHLTDDQIDQERSRILRATIKKSGVEG